MGWLLRPVAQGRRQIARFATFCASCFRQLLAVLARAVDPLRAHDPVTVLTQLRHHACSPAHVGLSLRVLLAPLSVAALCASFTADLSNAGNAFFRWSEVADSSLSCARRLCALPVTLSWLCHC